MASSIIGGLVSAGWPTDHIVASDPSDDQRRKLASEHQINSFESNSECISNADVIVLATKPQVLKGAIDSIRKTVFQSASPPLIISIAAGVTGADILRWFGSALPLVRVMPNTPALVNHGVSALFANDLCSQASRDIATKIMGAVGKTVWVKTEQDIDTVTGISGSGPAYFFKLMEVMVETAIRNGLSEADAKTLVLETASGAAKLASASSSSPEELRKQFSNATATTERSIPRSA